MAQLLAGRCNQVCRGSETDVTGSGKIHDDCLKTGSSCLYPLLVKVFEKCQRLSTCFCALLAHNGRVTNTLRQYLTRTNPIWRPKGGYLCVFRHHIGFSDVRRCCATLPKCPLEWPCSIYGCVGLYLPLNSGFKPPYWK